MDGVAGVPAFRTTTRPPNLPYRCKERLHMKLNITAAAAILLIGTSTMTNADDNVQVVRELPTAPGGGLYTSNRARWCPARW